MKLAHTKRPAMTSETSTPPGQRRRWRTRLAGSATAALLFLVVFNLHMGSTDGWRGIPGAAPPLSAEQRLVLARRFAPQLRFNAYRADGPRTRQNTNEDYFPMGVARFLRQIVSGETDVVIQESQGAQPAVIQQRQFQTTPHFGHHALSGFPKRMVGDPPGEAPTYFHIYEDLDSREALADGARSLTLLIEYWSFYPYDRADAKVLGLGHHGDHRGDWEHITLRILAQQAASGDLGETALEWGAYYAHGGGVTVSADEMERAKDSSQPQHTDTHPVVYVAQGKHASYPEAGTMHGHEGIPLWLVNHVDVFWGNGVVVDTWKNDLFDLEDPKATPAEFASAEFQAISKSTPLADWTRFSGRWGSDYAGFRIPLLGRATIYSSPIGAAAKGNYGQLGKNLVSWQAFKAQGKNIRLSGKLPQVTPPPVPIRGQ